MKIVALTDIHNRLKLTADLVCDLKQTDLTIIAGDFTTFGTVDEVRGILLEIQEYCPELLAVHGNCDNTAIENFLQSAGVSIHASGRYIGELFFAGVGGSLPCPSPTPTVYSEEELEGLLNCSIEKRIDSTPFVLISHQPPLDTVTDRIGNGLHVGSRSVRDFIIQHTPLLCITGHIHEGAGEDTIGPTAVVNPGAASGGNYAIFHTKGTSLCQTIRKQHIKSCII